PARKLDLTVLKLTDRRDLASLDPRDLKELPGQRSRHAPRSDRKGGAKKRHGTERNNYKKGRRGRKSW
ncbi:MAG: hypothetical protein JNK53_03570, partial [Phycisphaerae bacterium]|nr:hypothetical protein [Phycisphaerae bacterium]